MKAVFQIQMGIGIMNTEQLQPPALDLPKTEPFDVTQYIVEDLMSFPPFPEVLLAVNGCLTDCQGMESCFLQCYRHW